MEKMIERLLARKIDADLKTLRQIMDETICNYFNVLGNEQPMNIYPAFLREIERPLLEALIIYTNFSQIKMSEILGISIGTLRKKLKKYGLLNCKLQQNWVWTN
ncbi:MAG TPA: helix-turn-helix domain-containing protein [Gammaproteobacteria bacterium]|nr:helix-turn-helix domain-containing protein [Gammaproteobacteria bacterium]